MNSLLSNPLKSIIFVFHWQLRMKTKEEIFIEQINLKRREAYHELFRRFYRSLVIFALKYIDEQGEAEDIVQELFVSVWEKEEKFMSYASFRVFLYNAVRNACLNRIKHKKVEEKYAAYRQLHPENPELDDYDIMEEEIYRWLFKTIDELPPRCKEIFLLHLDGKKNEEIAAQLKITLLTVKTQKKKALRYIREKMQDFGLLYILLI